MLVFRPWKIIFVLLLVVVGVLFSVPNFVPATQRFQPDPITNELEAQGIWRFIPNRSVNLGLDLQGGSQILFQVDMEEVRVSQLNALREDAVQAMRRDTPILTRSVSVVGEEVVVLIARAEDRAQALDRLRTLSQPVQSQFGQPTLAESLEVYADSDDDRAVRLTITDEQLNAIRTRTLAQSIEVIRNRLDGLGTVDPTIVREGDERILVQVPGADDPQRIIDLVGQAAVMSFHMVDSTIDAGPNGDRRVPPGRQILPMSPDNGGGFLVLESRALLTGDNLTNSAAIVDARYAAPVVSFRFDTQGAIIFGDVTRNNAGRSFAIVLDGEIISAPRINEPILGGSGIIQGGFTFETASDLAILLNAGSLPASLTPVSSFTITGTLGADQIEAGRMAVIIGFIAVIIFMVASYGVFGVFATSALLINVVLILGGLSGLGMTLTLPGIAGIILTIGMAVDANVLIFERIREEARLGRTPANAMETGYSRALVAILDANITTFIAAGVLYMLGAGPVRGFAVTLGIGIITSVFTAFVFSRLLAVTWLRAFKPKTLPF